MSDRLLDDVGSLFERIARTYERGFDGPGLASRDWPVLVALFERLARDGIEAATDAERQWLAELEEDVEYADARAAFAGSGIDNAIARARLTDERREKRRAQRRGEA